MTITLPRPWPSSAPPLFAPVDEARLGPEHTVGATIALVKGPTPSRLSTIELQSLVDRARRDDADAWEVLYRVSYARLLAYARRRLWGFTEADDAVSETFARAYPRIAAFEWTGSGFNAWLFGILRNVMLEAQRSDRRSNVVDGQTARIEDDCLDGLLRDEEVVAVRAAFASLAPDDREILELRVVGGLSAEEVGLVLGKRPGAVRMAQSRALGRLRTAMERVSAGG